MDSLMQFVSDHYAAIIGWGLFIGSEVSVLFPKLAEKSIVQLGWRILKRLAMKKGISKAIVLVVSLLLLGGCSFFNQATFDPPATCLDGAESEILTYFPNPTGLSKSLLVVQVAALEKIKDYQRADAEAILDEIENAIVASDMTYAELLAYVSQKINLANKKIGLALFILGDDTAALDKPLPISECDKSLIMMHLAKQRSLLLFY